MSNKGPLTVLVGLVLLFFFLGFTEPGHIIWRSILNNTRDAKQGPVMPLASNSITNPVYEPAKTGDVLIFPNGTDDWRVISYAYNDGLGSVHTSHQAVIEYWCHFAGDKPEQWTRCYPSTGIKANPDD